MKKNIILLVIDSVDYDRIQTAESRGIDNLFLKELEGKSITATNLYSQAPYTEAATMALYCGQNTLDYGGYLEKFNKSPETIFETFKKNGYDVFFNGFQPHIFPSSLVRGIDSFYYNCGFSFEGGIYYYRLEYYGALYKENKLTENDWSFLLKAMDDNFREWMLFLDRWIGNDESVELIRNLSSGFDANEAKSLLSKEIRKYNKDRKQYIIEIFNKGKSHELFTIPTLKLDEKIKNRDFLKDSYNKYKRIIRKAWKKNFSRNLFNNFLTMETFKEMKRIFFECAKKKDFNFFLRYIYAWIRQLFDSDMIKRITPDYDGFKASPDIDSHFNQFIKWEQCKRDRDKPYFACIHVDDMHNPEAIFSYDSEDRELLDCQFEQIERIIDDLPKKYKGSITYDLSIVHHSNRVKEIIKNLEVKNIINKDTYFIITADHGFGFSGDPVRERDVTNFYLENYNIPFIVYNQDVRNMIIDKLATGTDVPATILDLCNIEKPDNFKGKSMLSKDFDREFVLIEYLGSGCPDFGRRIFFYAVFDNEYFLSAYVTLGEEIEEKHIKDIYHLVKDKKQLNNLKGKLSIKEEKLDRMFNRIKNRHNEVRKENKVNI